MQINIYKESTPSGKTVLHPLDFPGCYIKGLTYEDALHRFPQGFASYLKWREKHGFSIPSGEFTFIICEEKRGGAFHPGNMAAFFAYDETPVTIAEREEFFRLMAASREDLLTIIHGLPKGSLELWEVSPDWSIKETLRHIAAAERFYLSRLFPEGALPRSPRSKDVYDRIELMRTTSVEVLAQLSPEELGKKVVKADDYWTARKVFRRYLEHEREHIGQILRILVHHQLLNDVSFDFVAMADLFRGISWKEN